MDRHPGSDMARTSDDNDFWAEYHELYGDNQPERAEDAGLDRDVDQHVSEDHDDDGPNALENWGTYSASDAAPVEFPTITRVELPDAWFTEAEAPKIIGIAEEDPENHTMGCGCPGCCMRDDSDFDLAGDGALSAEGTASQAAALGDMADYLRVGYWEDTGRSARAYNLNDTGTNAKSGVIHYNVTGYTNAGAAGSDADGLSFERAELVREALQLYEVILGIDFVETTSSDRSFTDMFFKDNDSGAYAGTSTAFGTISYSYINIATSWSGATSTYNDYTLQTIFHEIGHALGLGHQGPYNGTAIYSPTPDETTDNAFVNDSWQASMMSYFSQTENTSINANYELLQTPMSVDWMALDDMYGGQSSGGTTFGVQNAFIGDTVYGFNTNITSAESDIWAQYANYAHISASTIIDAGGIDTLDFSGYSASQTINLTVTTREMTQASVSNIGGRIGNLTLAEGTVIENAIGGSGSDTFFGNDVANVFTGNGGNDLFWDSLGGDTYLGGAGTDDRVNFSQAIGAYTLAFGNSFLEIGSDAVDFVENTVEWLAFAGQLFTFQDVVDLIQPNTPPTINNDAYAVAEDVVLSGENVLDNDTDPDQFEVLNVTAVNGSASNVGNQILLASGALLTVNSDGTFSYDQNGVFDSLGVGQQGFDSFSYTGSDGEASGSATVTITINGAFDSQPPSANNDTALVTEDVVLTGLDVLANDTDPEDDTLTIVAIAGISVALGDTVVLASGAWVTLELDGTLSYDQRGAFDTLDVGETDQENFSYTISDANSTDQANVTITINGAFDNQAPTAVNDNGTTDEASVLAGNVLANDSDSDGGTPVVSAVNGSAGNVGTQIVLASGALLTLNADGSYSYDPNGVFDGLEAGQTGNDSFTYAIIDGQGGSDTATVSITINGISAPTTTAPVTIDFEAETAGAAYTGAAGLIFDGLDVTSGGSMTGSRYGITTAADGYDFSITAGGEDFDLNGVQLRSVSGRTRVTVEAFDNGVLVGTATFNTRTNRITDGTFDTAFDSVDQVFFLADSAFTVDEIALLTRTVISGNLAPSATDDGFAIAESGSVVGANLITGDNGNGPDSDPEDDALTLVSVDGDLSGSTTLGSGALVTFNSDGTFSYDPNGAFDALNDGDVAFDIFDYEIFDGEHTATGTITVTINGEGTPPPPPPGPTTYMIGFESGLVEDGFEFTSAATTTRDPGVASGGFAAESIGDTMIFSMLSGDSFDFEAGVFTSVSGNNKLATVEGYLDGELVASQIFRVRANKELSKNLDSNFDTVDEVHITANGGIIVDDLMLIA